MNSQRSASLSSNRLRQLELQVVQLTQQLQLLKSELDSKNEQIRDEESARADLQQSNIQLKNQNRELGRVNQQLSRRLKQTQSQLAFELSRFKKKQSQLEGTCKRLQKNRTDLQHQLSNSRQKVIQLQNLVISSEEKHSVKVAEMRLSLLSEKGSSSSVENIQYQRTIKTLKGQLQEQADQLDKMKFDQANLQRRIYMLDAESIRLKEQLQLSKDQLALNSQSLQEKINLMEMKNTQGQFLQNQILQSQKETQGLRRVLSQKELSLGQARERLQFLSRSQELLKPEVNRLRSQNSQLQKKINQLLDRNDQLQFSLEEFKQNIVILTSNIALEKEKQLRGSSEVSRLKELLDSKKAGMVDLEKQLSRKSSEIEAIEQQSTALNQRIEMLVIENEAWKKKVLISERRIEELTVDLKSQQQTNSHSSKELELARQTITSLQQKLSQRSRSVTQRQSPQERISSLQKQMQQTKLQVILRTKELEESNKLCNLFKNQALKFKTENQGMKSSLNRSVAQYKATQKRLREIQKRVEILKISVEQLRHLEKTFQQEVAEFKANDVFTCSHLFVNTISSFIERKEAQYQSIICARIDDMNQVSKNVSDDLMQEAEEKYKQIIKRLTLERDALGQQLVVSVHKQKDLELQLQRSRTLGRGLKESGEKVLYQSRVVNEQNRCLRKMVI